MSDWSGDQEYYQIKMHTTMEPPLDFMSKIRGEQITFAAGLSLLVLGIAFLCSMKDHLILSRDFLFGFISFTLLVAVMGIKNANNG
jgi:hypothetical protein